MDPMDVDGYPVSCYNKERCLFFEVELSNFDTNNVFLELIQRCHRAAINSGMTYCDVKKIRLYYSFKGHLLEIINNSSLERTVKEHAWDGCDRVFFFYL